MVASGLGPTALAVTWSEFAAGTALMALRIYTNGFIIRRWNPDFWWAFSSYVCAILSSAFLTISVDNGIGAHFSPATPSSNPDPQSQLYQLIFTTFSILAIAFGKMAVIQFILQLEGTNRNGKRILYICAASNCMVSFIFIPLLWAQCNPVNKIWNPSIAGACYGRETYTIFAYFQGSFGAALDTALALYPAIMLWHLQVKLHVKLGLVILFGFGILAAITAVVKTVQIGTVKAMQDTTFHQGYLDIWASTNLWVVFIASCIPTIRPILVRIIHKVTGKEGNTTIATGYVYEATLKDSKNDSAKSRKVRAYSKVYTRGQGSGNAATKNVFESEENIMPGKDEIVMTTEYQVKYEESQDSLSEKGLGRAESWKDER
ncbi:uncharacterized protein K444DRAFT_660403 [Hyaloscypha bicolor E]|uniref:Rhodopsin domain-containing protein n=1 Tax=Hyaloscypha bicolor E TaxID=1095630 RepID=A0A2J6TNI1_9HELO|nr:uncharacterized protein K444DRAFT_660403 [Hyaloscypha bicolor E]PMD64508.1 hypothetical protein K444DRAFT_660403 [Hyaloscypha bicolor E]